ncbi:NnrU family protein [Sandarakinorhabdus oryzae]|uniref:NnrU family protein n=1 Tax=Sandarakinorhabdus oryzae TaxID=2675220 RepID=UPI0012E1ACBE|nr:NnrU family protein [Sandarakinorhabdus oryzae]
MSDLMLLALLVGLFVVSHELLSHPLRGPLVARLGEKGFAILYSLIALASFGSAVQLWRQIPKDRLWDTPASAYIPAMVAMLVACIFFVGSVSSPNPAMMPGVKGEPKGLQRITRHPMMWSFAIWAAVHIVMTADPRTILLACGVAVLALFGTAMQDGKKKAQNPAYAAHMARTSHFPFLAILGGRQPLRALWPGLVPVLGGLALWLLLLWAHPMLIGVPAAGWSYFQ